MGPFPRSIALSGKFSSDIFTRKGTSLPILGTQLTSHKGELKHIHKLKFWPLHSVLMDKYLISEYEALQLESFLQPMLNLNPDKRATAQGMLTHEWFNGVIVEGEIELEIRNGQQEQVKERIELGKRTAEGIGGMDVESVGVRNASTVDPCLVHALRPVDKELEIEVTGASKKVGIESGEVVQVA